MIRAALYARYSTQMQSAASIDDQFRLCERLAERHGFTVIVKFSDAAISGGTASRPGYQDMLTAARRHDFDVIVAEDSSRLWRNLAEQSPRLAELSDLGIAVVTHDLDTRHESAEIMGAVGGAMASAYRKEIGRRTRRGLEGLARLQRPTGGRAYGYVSATDASSGNREINPDHAPVVRWIFEQYAAGWSSRRIAEDLNSRKVPSPGASWNRDERRRGGWLCSAIAGDPKRGIGILNNDMYRSVVVWNRAKWIRSAADSGKRKQAMNPRTEWVEHTDESLRIVSDALWDRVKARQQIQAQTIGKRVKRGLAIGAASKTGPGPRHLFSTLLECGVCGANFVVVDKYRWGCSSHKHGGKSACPNDLRLKRDLIENGLLDGVRRALLSPAALEEFRRRVVKRIADQNRRQKAPDAKRMAELKAQVGNLADAIMSGALKASPALASRLAAAEAELSGLRAQAVPREVVKLDRVIPRIDDGFRELVEDLPNAVKRDIDRARATVRQYTGNAIKVETDGKTVRFMSESMRLETSLLIAAGGSAPSQTNVVAGVGFEPTTFGL
jgi:site-specific DNA recombinase